MKYPLVKWWFFEVPIGIFFKNFTWKKSLWDILRDSLLDTATKRIIKLISFMMTFDCVLYKMVTARMVWQNKHWSIQNMFCFHLLSSISKNWITENLPKFEIFLKFLRWIKNRRYVSSVGLSTNFDIIYKTFFSMNTFTINETSLYPDLYHTLCNIPSN